MRSDHKILTNASIKNDLPSGPRTHHVMKMNRILIGNLYYEKSKKSFLNQPMSKNLKACENHLNPVSVENRLMSETLKTKPSSIQCNEIVSFKNQLQSKNPKTNDHQSQSLSLENRPKSEILKTILMIPVIVLVSILLFLKNGIFLRGLYKPVLIDMPGPHNPEPLYRLKNQSVGISTETNFAGKQYAYTITDPISAYAHLLVTSGKTENPFFAE
jgi:hypothetical protein